LDELAPVDKLDVGVCDTDRDRLDVELGVIEGVGDDEGVALDVNEALDEKELDVEGVSESEPVLDELAPLETLEAGVCDTDRERLDVGLGVIEGVGDEEGVSLEVGDALAERELEVDGVSEIVPVFDELAPEDTLEVGDCDTERE
jgi:hypothetical protein